LRAPPLLRFLPPDLRPDELLDFREEDFREEDFRAPLRLADLREPLRDDFLAPVLFLLLREALFRLLLLRAPPVLRPALRPLLLRAPLLRPPLLRPEDPDRDRFLPPLLELLDLLAAAIGKLRVTRVRSTHSKIRAQQRQSRRQRGR
jgi:hypothetical protein